MKVLLRQTKTRVYYVGAGRWTADVEQALDFGSVEHAIQLSLREGLSAVEVSLNFDDGGEDLALPLTKQ
jgi:hypothetical protein